ncbi:hypothetical protein [Streptomyces sp. OK228]|uniref:LexA family protein n=1 Tax=Streptomyces sp. OK228 TaxID=1882786 RepID=UPI000BDC5BEA|nr:hypothetical protein [Streptomyces sp. OK228]SOE25590.1 repressor LexA [Streptomyces sp. OK228]
MYRVDHITPRQERIVTFIREQIAEYGMPPTVRQIGEAIGLRSPASVHYQLSRIERLGLIVREGGRLRLT